MDDCHKKNAAVERIKSGRHFEYINKKAAVD
jgi:hypothetical protein